MKEKALKLIKHPLIYGSTIVIVGNVAANFFNFLFNLYMTRNLSNADYGILASIVSLIGFPALIVSATIPLVMQFAGQYYAQGKLDLVRSFYIKIIKFFSVLGLAIFVGFLLFIPQLSSFLHIKDTFLLVITSFVILLGIINVVNMAFIQAKLAFAAQVMVSMVGAVVKLAVGVIAIWIGFRVDGAVGAIFLSALFAYFASFLPLKFLFKKSAENKEVPTKELWKYGIPSTLAWVGLTSLNSIDIILVKHFFDPVNAGIYAAMALIAKVIFYVSSPISSVMFPLLVKKFNNKESISSTFKLSLLLVFAPSALLTAFYFLFPEATIIFFTKKTENLIVSDLVGYFGVFMSLYTLLYIIVNFYLSVKKTNVYIPVLLGAILQVIAIYLFHETFAQIITIAIAITSALVVGLIAYYYFIMRKR